MKCIVKDKEYKRVKDKEAFGLVKKGWNYCSKGEYKKNLKVAKKVESEVVKEVVEEVETEVIVKKAKKTDYKKDKYKK